MREPKRLAHRQAERNRARALKQWSHEDGDEENTAGLAPAELLGDQEGSTNPSIAGAYPACQA